MATAFTAGLSVLGLGLVMGFSPTTYAVVVHLLGSARRPVASVHWLCAGIAAASTLLMAVFRTVDPETIAHVYEGRAEAFLVRRGVDLTAGILFLAAATWEFRRSRGPQAPPRPRKPHSDRPLSVLGIGALNTMVGVSGPATMYVTGRVITAATDHLALQGCLYAVFLTGLVGPYLLGVRLWNRFPAVGRRVTVWTDWISRQDARPLVALGLALAGAVFLALGLHSLLVGP